VLNLINNQLINCAGTNSSNFTMILNFITQNRIHFKTRKKTCFLSYPKPGFLIFAPNWKHYLRVHHITALSRTVAVSLMRQYRNSFYSNADHTRRIKKGRDVTKSDACDQKTQRTHAVCI